MRSLGFIAFACLCLAGAAQAQTLPPSSISSTVPAGVKRQIGFFSSINADCSSAGDIQSRLAKAPKHGTVELEEGLGYSNYPLGNLRFLCNRNPVMGVRIFYTSQDGYTGKDEFEADFFAPNGSEVVWNYFVKVK